MRSFTDSSLDRSGAAVANRASIVGATAMTVEGEAAEAGGSTVEGATEPARSGRFSIDEANHVRQRGIVAQLAVLVARNVVDLANGREHFRLLDGVDAEVGFEIEIEVEHVGGIAGLLHHQRQDALLHGIARCCRLCGFHRCRS